jgi:hypothetical protein
VNFGKYDHQKGTQLIDSRSAKAIVNSFHSIRGRLMRGFRGIPIFIGHPDDPEFSSKNGKIYGRIDGIRAENSALWISIKWTDVGREIFENGVIKYLSPRWMTTRDGSGNLIPKRLLSVGMTNHPNIRCDHVSVEDAASEIGGMLELSSENNTKAESSVNCKQSDSAESSVNCEGGNSTENLASCKGNDSAENSTICGKSNSTENFASCKGGDSAESSVNCEGGDSAESSLAQPGRVALHTVSQTESLRMKNANESNCEKILELVFERMKIFSERYEEAWMAVKRKNPALFQNKI